MLVSLAVPAVCVAQPTGSVPRSVATTLGEQVAPAIRPTLLIRDRQSRMYAWTFSVNAESTGRIYVSIAAPCGGGIRGEDAMLYVSAARPIARLPVPTGCTTFMRGTVSLMQQPSRIDRYLLFTGDIHATDGTTRHLSDVIVAHVPRTI